MEGQGQGRPESEKMIGEGQTIPVSVESVFRDGFVVSFIAEDGLEYRGALLCQNSWCSRQQQPATLNAPNNPFANPLTLLHDHPYTNMKKYAKHISTNIPAEVVLHWNSVPSFSPVHPTNLQEIAERRERPLISEITERPIHVVEADPESELCTFPCYVPGLERQAKVLAQLRMRANVLNAKEFRKSPPLERPKVKKRSPAPNFKAKTQRVRSPDTETTHLKKPSSLPKIPLRTFSIHLEKVPVTQNGISDDIIIID